MIVPQNIEGEELAIFIHDVHGNCGGSAVMFGIARYKDGEFYAERTQDPIKLPIPESAWPSLKKNENPGEGETFAEADYIVRLVLAPLPEDQDISDFQKVDIPILKD